MPSLPKPSATGKPFLVCFANVLLILLFLSPSSIRGSSLREHRLRGSESDSPRGNLPQDANTDMLKALEYIESLREQSGTDSKQRSPLTAGHDAARMDDNERLRAMLRLGSNPGQSQDQAELDEEDEDQENTGKDDKSEELLEAVLSALQQTEKDSEPESRHPGGARSFPGEGAAARSKTGVFPRLHQRQRGGITPHKKLPLMFEDEEEGEGDDDDDDEEHESPFKRTKENVEEKYTPQNLATLQSVFEELGKLTSAKATHKRRREDDDTEAEDEEEEEEDDEDDGLNVRDVAYDDVGTDFEDWEPRQEEEEEEEEERNNERDLNRGMDYFDDEDEEGENEQDEESYPVKRSSTSDPQKDQDDIANLVDYYLLKVLEKTEEEEQKRELEEENERTERRVPQHTDKIDPQVIYQLIQISQKYQIPPEDLMDMMKLSNQDNVLLSQSRKNNELSRAENRFSQTSSKKTHKTPEAKSYQRRLPERQNPKTPEDLRIEEMLKILELGENMDPSPLRKQKQYKSSMSRLHTPPTRPSGESAPTQRLLLSKLKHDYDDALDEDELAAYLAAQMLARYPKPAYKTKTGQKRDQAGQTAPGLFEQALQDYFDQMDSDQSQTPMIQSNISEKGGATQMQGLDNKAVMKLLSYMNPESQDNDDDAKPAKEI